MARPDEGAVGVVGAGRIDRRRGRDGEVFNTHATAVGEHARCPAKGKGVEARHRIRRRIDVGEGVVGARAAGEGHGKLEPGRGALGPHDRGVVHPGGEALARPRNQGRAIHGAGGADEVVFVGGGQGHALAQRPAGRGGRHEGRVAGIGLEGGG